MVSRRMRWLVHVIVCKTAISHPGAFRIARI